MRALQQPMPHAPPAAPAAALPRPAAPALRRLRGDERRRRAPVCAVTAAPPLGPRPAEGHAALDLGAVGDLAPQQMAQLLRLAHIRAKVEGGDSSEAVKDSARGLLLWKAALARGLLPDDVALQQLAEDAGSAVAGRALAELRWPAEPLRGVLIRALSRLGVARFCQKYPAVLDTLLRSLLELLCKHEKALRGEAEARVERETDGAGNAYLTVAELVAQEAARRAVRAGGGRAPAAPAAQAAEAEEEEEDDGAEERAAWPPERRTAEALVAVLVEQWRKPMETLARAGRAFEGLEALLGGGRSGAFDLGGAIWGRKGWAEMDRMRARLEDLRELRDLVRSLGRGGGWGPLRRAPVQFLDERGRPGLLRTVLEAQETRGLTRSDDISRLLPSEAATLARGRRVRQSRLLFFAKLAEKALQTYERDGWGEYVTQIVPERREIRPTADRGPILLCVDTSGSMRGPRETVAKALALECMRAARAQERGCYVFAFAGPQEVAELSLGTDMAAVHNLLGFLEKVFNGGSDFNEPVRRCLDRLHTAAWANSDILLVSDGELRQPGPEVMRKLAGAKDKLGLRVHGLIVGSPGKKRADPAVLRQLCAHTLPNGKNELLVSEFEGWASVRGDAALAFDWDDAAGDAARRERGLRLEKLRNAEMKRRRLASRDPAGAKRDVAKLMPAKGQTDFDDTAKKRDPTRRMPGKSQTEF